MLVYNGSVYYYITNAQGDVIRLTNTNGETAARYQYDPYGNIIDSAGSHVDINPLRYRGYYYDSETNLYYLQSRYYDPNIGRFINADEYPSTGQGLLGNNMFAYCLNNPANFIDPEGNLAFPGQIHNEVVRRVANDYNLYKEQIILYEGGKWGRADLISPDGRVWDVKRLKQKQIEDGIAQVKKYVSNTWKNSPETKLSVGNNIVPMTSFNYKCGVVTYRVQYESVGNGIIAYDYKITDIDTKTVAQTAGVMVAVTLLGAISVVTGIPAFALI